MGGQQPASPPGQSHVGPCPFPNAKSEVRRAKIEARRGNDTIFLIRHMQFPCLLSLASHPPKPLGVAVVSGVSEKSQERSEKSEV